MPLVLPCLYSLFLSRTALTADMDSDDQPDKAPVPKRTARPIAPFTRVRTKHRRGNMVGKKGTRVFNLGTRPRYPITITKLYKRPGAQIALGESVLQYSYKLTGEVFNEKTGSWENADQTNVAEWSGPEDAKLLEWYVKEGDTIPGDRPCLKVEEACTHEVQVAGLCAWCGKDMSQITWANEQRDTDRAPST